LQDFSMISRACLGDKSHALAHQQFENSTDMTQKLCGGIATNHTVFAPEVMRNQRHGTKSGTTYPLTF
jgi:hypothetical protein